MKKIFLLITLFLTLTACEEIVTDTSGLIYEKQLIVRAFLFADSTPNIYIARTLPPLNSWDSNKAKVPDAEVSIVTRGQTFRLKYNNSTDRYVNSELVFTEGETYELTAKWDNRTVTATTTIPRIELTNYRYEVITNSYNRICYPAVYVTVKPTDKDVVLYGGRIINSNVSYYFSYNEMLKFSNNGEDTAQLPISMGGEEMFYHNSNDSIQAIAKVIANAMSYKYIVTAFDHQIWSYKLTRNSGDDWNIFGTSGTNPEWNVKGDGLGLFIGCTNKDFRFSTPQQ